MKRLALFATILFAFSGCLRPAEEFNGDVTISGVVTDSVVHRPVPGAVVVLSGSIQKQGPIGYSPLEDVIATDTTDATGAYAFEYQANGETAFQLSLQPSTTHLQYKSGSGQEYRIKGIGNHVLNLSAMRTAFARVQLENTVSGSTTKLSLIGPGDQIYISASKDTTVFLRIYGDNATPSALLLAARDTVRLNQSVKAAAGDTVAVQFRY